MPVNFKKHNYTWTVITLAIILAATLFYFLPYKKSIPALILGVAGGHLLLALIAVVVGWSLIPHKVIAPRSSEFLTNSGQSEKADYGQDMPGIIITASVIGLVFTALAILLYHLIQNRIYVFLSGGVALVLYILAIAGIWSSRFGKLKLRDKVFSILSFTGSEHILDIGCGKGLLLIEAAKRIPNGKAIGADTWDNTAEYNYTPQMALHNANLEGVKNRVSVITADVQCMPFDDCSFDVVMTSLMMHHVREPERALKEIVRVTRPGGTIIIADVNSKRFLPMLQSAGFEKVDVHYATRLFFIPAYVIAAVKPSGI